MATPARSVMFQRRTRFVTLIVMSALAGAACSTPNMAQPGPTLSPGSVVRPLTSGLVGEEVPFAAFGYRLGSGGADRILDIGFYAGFSWCVHLSRIDVTETSAQITVSCLVDSFRRSRIPQPVKE